MTLAFGAGGPGFKSPRARHHLGNKNAYKLPPGFPNVNLNTIDGINNAIKTLIQLTWEKKINNRTAAEIRSQLKFLKECLSSDVQGYTDEEIILLILISDELKPHREEFLKHYGEMIEEDTPTRWENDETNRDYFYSVIQDFADELPDKLRNFLLEQLEKWKKE